MKGDKERLLNISLTDFLHIIGWTGVGGFVGILLGFVTGGFWPEGTDPAVMILIPAVIVGLIGADAGYGDVKK